MKLIVGLGNPGNQYEKTRHNMGFMAVDYFAKKNNLKFDKEKFDGLFTEIIINYEKAIILKPQKFINLSGDVIIQFINYYKIAVSDILIICDDMDLDCGIYKLRFKGGSAGHNGLKNIESRLNTQDYKRLKIGVSRDANIDTVNYVLGKLTKEQEEKTTIIIEKVPNIIEDFVLLSFENLMNKYN